MPHTNKKPFPLINFEELQSHGVLIKRPEKFLHKYKKLLKDGICKLQVITDFDKTITVYKTSLNEIALTSHGVIETAKFIDPSVREKMRTMLKYYCPLETDASISEEKRRVYMEEWWTKAQNILTSTKLSHQQLVQRVSETISKKKVEIRSGFPLLLKLLDREKVPCLVFTAGICNVAQEILKQSSLLSDNVEVIGNKMVFDSLGILAKFSDPVIHSCNKNYQSIKGTDFESRTKFRSNIILIGDHLGDSKMTNGMENERMDIVIRVGLMNKDSDTRLKAYQDNFDVVIVKDGPIDFVHFLVQTACQYHTESDYQNVDFLSEKKKRKTYELNTAICPTPSLAKKKK